MRKTLMISSVLALGLGAAGAQTATTTAAPAQVIPRASAGPDRYSSPTTPTGTARRRESSTTAPTPATAGPIHTGPPDCSSVDVAKTVASVGP